MKEETEIQEPENNSEAGDVAPEQDSAAAKDPTERPGDEITAEVDELRDELASLNDQHLRLAAEFDNYRKRNQRERQTLATRLQADIVAPLLDVMDDLERVADSAPESDSEAILEGVRLVEKKFQSVLQGAGLTALEADGEPFDPELMEALMTVPTDDPDKDGRVADVFQRGYRFRDTLVRPARVRVWQYDEPGTSD